MSAPSDDNVIATQVDLVFDCLLPTTTGGTCVFPAGHDDPCQAMPPAVDLCRICRGRGQVPGTTGLCWTCQGSGVAE